MDMSDDEVDEEVMEMFDVDIENMNDAQSCSEYVNDIYRYLHAAQRKYMVGTYLKTQSDINSNMTSILLDWLVEVSEEYHLTNETLHLAKHYIERFLNAHKVARSRLQLVGVCGMLIAAKFEEVFPPGVDDFVYISDNTFTRAQVIETETLILSTLNWDLTNPTVLDFLNRYVRVSNADAVTTTLAKYLSEIALLDYPMSSFLPSHVALACLMLASHAHRITPALHKSLYVFIGDGEKDQLRSCVTSVYKLWLGAARSKLQAVRVKYEKTRNQKVALIAPPNTMPVF
jgi:cyclin A